MTETNYPTKSNEEPIMKKYFNKMIIAILVINIIGAWIYFFLKQNEKIVEIEKVRTEYITVDSTKNVLEVAYSAALTRLDSLTGYNTDLKNQLSSSNKSINKLKKQINDLLEKEKLSEQEVNEAIDLITRLNQSIVVMKDEIESLKNANNVLNVDLLSEKNKNLELTNKYEDVVYKNVELETKVNAGSTLFASDIKIETIKETKKGKERIKDVAKKVNKIKVSFDVMNRILNQSVVDLYVCVTGPNGKHIGYDNVFLSENGEKRYTAKLNATILKNVKERIVFTHKQEDFDYGTYTIEIYHGEHKIGEGNYELKKGWVL